MGSRHLEESDVAARKGYGGRGITGLGSVRDKTERTAVWGGGETASDVFPNGRSGYRPDIHPFTKPRRGACHFATTRRADRFLDALGICPQHAARLPRI